MNEAALASAVASDPVEALRAIDESLEFPPSLQRIITTGTYGDRDGFRRASDEARWLREQDRAVRAACSLEVIEQADLTIVHEHLMLRRVRLYLGAGVSMGPPASLPDWRTLVLELLRVAELEVQDASAASAIAATRERLSQTEGYTAEDLESATQVGQDTLGDTWWEPLRRYLTTALDSRVVQPPITALHEVIAARMQQSSLPAVTTYNFDDLLEVALAAAGVSHTTYWETGTTLHRARYHVEDAVWRSVESDADAGVQIYHVHGLLSRRILPDAPVQVTFGRADYERAYEIERRFTHVASMDFLFNDRVLFIGSSLADDAVRRLLLSSLKSTGVRIHYSLRALEGLDVASRRAEMERHAEMGVRIIWASRFEDLPSKLDQILSLSSDVH